MASEKQTVLLDAVKQAIDSLMVDPVLDDDTKGDLLDEIVEYAEEQQEMLGEDDDDEDDVLGDNDSDEDVKEI